MTFFNNIVHRIVALKLLGGVTPDVIGHARHRQFESEIHIMQECCFQSMVSFLGFWVDQI